MGWAGELGAGAGEGEGEGREEGGIDGGGGDVASLFSSSLCLAAFWRRIK